MFDWIDTLQVGTLYRGHPDKKECPVFCSNCGSQLSGTEQFCSSCGKAVAGPTAVSGAPETAIASGSATTVNTGMPGRCTSAGYQSSAAGGWAAPANAGVPAPGVRCPRCGSERVGLRPACDTSKIEALQKKRKNLLIAAGVLFVVGLAVGLGGVVVLAKPLWIVAVGCLLMCVEPSSKIKKLKQEGGPQVFYCTECGSVVGASGQ